MKYKQQYHLMVNSSQNQQIKKRNKEIGESIFDLDKWINCYSKLYNDYAFLSLKGQIPKHNHNQKTK